MKALKKLREVAGLTQIELGQKVHVARSKISLAESGQFALSQEEVRVICRVLARELRKRGAQLAEAVKCAEDLHVSQRLVR
jgi:transcriptional regulator with XRE-family HTH domain